MLFQQVDTACQEKQGAVHGAVLQRDGYYSIKPRFSRFRLQLWFRDPTLPPTKTHVVEISTYLLTPKVLEISAQT